MYPKQRTMKRLWTITLLGNQLVHYLLIFHGNEFVIFPVDKYLSQVNNKDIRTTSMDNLLVIRQISKRALQGSKAHQFFRKTNISYPLIRTHACAYQGVRNVFFFRKIWRAFFSCNTRFEILPFALFPTNHLGLQ